MNFKNWCYNRIESEWLGFYVVEIRYVMHKLFACIKSYEKVLTKVKDGLVDKFEQKRF